MFSLLRRLGRTLLVYLHRLQYKALCTALSSLIVGTLLTSVLPAYANETGIVGEQEAVSKINQYREGILNLEGDIAVKQGEINQDTKKEQNLLAELSELDLVLNNHKRKLNELIASSDKQKLVIAEQEVELEKIRKQRDNVRKHLEKRSTAFYTMGDIGMINATFSNRTLPDLLTFRNSFQELIQYDKKILKAYQATLDLREKAQKALKLENEVLQGFVNRAKEEEEEVAIAKAQLLAKIEEIRGKRNLRKQAVRELRNNSRSLANSIAKVKDEFLQKQQKFAESKGTLPMPVANSQIVTRYHHWASNKFGEQTRCDGIEIEVPDHTTVRAIGDGKVIYSGYLEGYGNTVIINHGMNYYTVTARLEELFVKTGAEVKQNEEIALTGDTATLFSNGIYFEIRHKQHQQDPLSWIDREQVVIKD